ncbi:MAG: ATP-grasp domain-containing protein [Armatimonadetes bacterium]|nr:ATP-grasp domain-containing protein [Armatimonadota bacterium]MDE2207618.1 ATP-grasp domain-containing protein [Armatimonadota bacterium]
MVTALQQPDPHVATSRVPAVIFGPSAAAAAVLLRHGIPVTVVHDGPLRTRLPAGASFQICPSYSEHCDDHAWVEALVATRSSTHEAPRSVLFPSTDRALLAIGRQRPLLDARFVVEAPPPDVAAMVIDKAAFAAWALECRLPIPDSLLIPRGSDPLAVRALPMPVIIKPQHTFQLEVSDGAKLFLAADGDQAVEMVKRCHSRDMDVVAQQDLSAFGSRQWSLCVLCGPDGDILSAVLSLKLRQVAWGAGTAVETIPMDHQVFEAGKQVCRALGTPGIFEIELRPDAAGAPRVIEVNARIWSQVELPQRAGIDLLYGAWCAAIGRPVALPSRYRAGIVWWSWKRDLRVSAYLARHGRLNAIEFLSSIVRARVIE